MLSRTYLAYSPEVSEKRKRREMQEAERSMFPAVRLDRDGGIEMRSDEEGEIRHLP